MKTIQTVLALGATLLGTAAPLFGQCTPSVQFKLSPPNVTTSAIQGQVGSLTENFNGIATGNLPTSGTMANGTFTKTGTAQIKPDDIWGGSGSQYLQVNGASSIVNITLTNPSRYVGFWWGAGDAANKLKMYAMCNGQEVKLAEFSTADVLALLNGATIVANDANTYATSLYRHPNTGTEPFAYINVQLNDSNFFFTRIEVGGGGFELDNLTTSAVYGAGTGTVATAPTLVAATANGSQVSLDFTPPTFNGGTPITNYQYSIDSGTTWITFVPADTSSPLSFNTIFGGLFQMTIRAENGIGVSPKSIVVALAMGEEELALLRFTVLPNPASDEVRLDVAMDTEDIQSVALVDELGRTVMVLDHQTEAKISLAGIPKGLYWAVAVTKYGMVKQPLVVQ